MSKPRALTTLAASPSLARRLRLLGALACVACLASLPCAGCVILSPDAAAVTTIDAPPRAQFDDLGLLMGHRCGTLDCHGQTGRNLRIYGQYGLRLSSTDIPGGNPTTTAELDADYESSIALEPEIMSEVVQQGGAQPDRLTLVRKPRAEEHHKGGQVFVVGDPQDVCMTSWLAGTTDTSSCIMAIRNYP